MDFFVPTQLGEFELVEKKSRFLGSVCQVNSQEEAKDHLDAIRKQYHDARHHCWCYRLDDREQRYSDDGEPQGTAGQPMLNLFTQEKIQQVSCVVTRYFGGTLLGTGGLVRAYSHTAKGAMARAGRSVYESWEALSILVPYPLLEKVQRVLSQVGGQVVSSDYGVDVALEAEVPGEKCQEFLANLTQETAGQVLAEPQGQVLRLVPWPEEG